MIPADSASRRPPAANHKYPLGFRSDIEGLRAVAILLVVAAHAGIPMLEGGFVGVDVFFVLSGYLITGLLLQEINRTGSVDLIDFYARRLRRLLPALLLVVACTCLAAAVLLAPSEQLAQTSAAAAASTWVSNLLFAFARVDYFGQTAEENLFLHTWSLGVEEQFYLVWPLFVLFLLGACAWQGRHRDLRRLRNGMAATVVVCLLFSVLMTYLQPAIAFFTMPSRAWQFALGALAMMGWRAGPGAAPAGGQAPAARPRLATATGWIGLALILSSAVLLDDHTAYPGYWALVPSLGTAGVLYAGAPGRHGDGVGRLLSLPPMQLMGRVSYGWYLWHWPVLLLGSTFIDDGQPWLVAGLVALSLLLALASHRLVESPIRRSRPLVAHPKLALLSGLVLTASAWFAVAAWQGKATEWSQHPDQHRFDQARADAPPIYAMGCDDWYHSARVNPCLFGPEGAPRTVVLLGDSIGLQWFPAFARYFDKPGWRVVVLTKSSCPMVDEAMFYPRIGREYTECSAWRDRAIQVVAQLKPDVVVLGSAAAYAFTESQWIEGTGRIFERIAASADTRIYVIPATPKLPVSGPACLSRRAWRARTLPPGDDRCEWDSSDASRQAIQGWIEEAVARHPGTTTLDLNDLVCPGGRCRAMLDGRPVFRDAQHLAAGFAASLSDKVGARLGIAGMPPSASTSDSMPTAE